MQASVRCHYRRQADQKSLSRLSLISGRYQGNGHQNWICVLSVSEHGWRKIDLFPMSSSPANKEKHNHRLSNEKTRQYQLRNIEENGQNIRSYSRESDRKQSHKRTIDGLHHRPHLHEGSRDHCSGLNPNGFAYLYCSSEWHSRNIEKVQSYRHVIYSLWKLCCSLEEKLWCETRILENKTERQKIFGHRRERVRNCRRKKQDDPCCREHTI